MNIHNNFNKKLDQTNRSIKQDNDCKIIDELCVVVQKINFLYINILKHAENRIIHDKEIILFPGVLGKLARLKASLQMLQIYLNDVINNSNQISISDSKKTGSKKLIDLKIQCILIYIHEFVVGAIEDAYCILGASGYMASNKICQEWLNLERILSKLLSGRIDYQFFLSDLSKYQ